MSAWRRAALERIPACKVIIEESATINDLWMELRLCFQDAWDRARTVGMGVAWSPDDERLIAGVFEYGSWCLNSARNAEPIQAAVLYFYEPLPVEPSVRPELPHWISLEDFEQLQRGGAFRYFLNDPTTHADFLDEFRAAKLALSNPPKKTKRR